MCVAFEKPARTSSRLTNAVNAIADEWIFSIATSNVFANKVRVNGVLMR
jgi:hypothetical protein